MKTMQILSLFMLLTTVALAEPVAWVAKLYGDKNLRRQQTRTSPWYRAFLEQEVEIGNRFETDSKSMASIKFLLGGKASLGKGSQIEIVSESGVKIIELKRGIFWARFDFSDAAAKDPDRFSRSQAAPVRIKTAGGVMGIRGTEFIVQVLDDGSTKLSLLEGDIDIDPTQGGNFEAKPGNEVTFSPSEPLLHRLYKVEELQSKLKAELGPEYAELRNGLYGLSSRLRELNLEVREAEMVYLNNTLTARLADLGGDTQGRNAAVESAQTSREHNELTRQADELDAMLKRFEKPSGTKPDMVLATSEHPSLHWDLEKSDNYGILFLDAENDELVHWVDETPNSEYTHPTDAEPFAPGLYRYRVIPLDDQGGVAGTALEGKFRVEG